MTARISASDASLGGITLPEPALSSLPAVGSKIRIGIRPEHLDETKGISLEVKADVVEHLGSTTYVHAQLASGETIVAEKRRSGARPGDVVKLTFDPAHLRYFTTDGSRLR